MTTRIRYVAAIIGATAFVSIGAYVSAQVPTLAARHVRSVPIKVGRLVGAPVMSGTGAFAPLRGAPKGVHVFGIVQNHTGVLVPNAGVVIVRELLTGKVVGKSEVNDVAQFSIRSLPADIYTAELVGQSGAVIASTPAFSATAGETIQISQTIAAGPLQGFAKGVASATSTALVTAASSGVLAVRPGAPVSPGS